MTIFFTSDLHFGHKNILTYTRRGEVKPQDICHDEWLIDIWNKQVKENDTVYHLGDFSFHGWKRSNEIISRLFGQKVMIRGNHDGEKSWKLYKDIKNVRCYDYKEISHEKVKIVLFHFPIEIWHSQHKGAWHLHGHSHGNFVKPDGFLLDVGIDSAYNILGEHRLFTMQDVCDYMKTRTLSKKKDHHGNETLD